MHRDKTDRLLSLLMNGTAFFGSIKKTKNAQEIYLDFLRDMLKDKPCIHLAYMTGILPIKKYGTHSALNMFDEFSMIDPGPIGESMLDLRKKKLASFVRKI